MITRVAVNAEAAVREWLREQPAVTAVVGRRIFIGVPPETATGERNYPLIGIHRLSSGVEAYLPVDRASVQIDCWGPMRSQIGANRASAAVVDALWNLLPNIPLDADTQAKGVSDVISQWLPDPVSDRPRYIVTATLFLTPKQEASP